MYNVKQRQNSVKVYKITIYFTFSIQNTQAENTVECNAWLNNIKHVTVNVD